MRRKKTKRKPPALRPPPLSGVDKAIYAGLLLAVITLSFGMILGILKLHLAIAYADPTVIAAESRGTMFWLLPFLMVFLTVSLGTVSAAFVRKQPIFGKKGVRYGSAQYAPVYPLFRKDRPELYVRPSEKRFRRALRRFSVGALAITLLLAPLSLCGRNSLRQDMSITVYSVFDQEKHLYEKEDIETVTFAIYHTRGAGRGWHLRAQIVTKDGRRYDFMGDPDTMVYIKSRVSPSKIRYKRAEYLEALIRDKRYNASEAALVRGLFGK